MTGPGDPWVRPVQLGALLLTATAWLPLIVGSRWFWTTATICTVSAVGAMAADRVAGRRLHTRWVGPLVSLLLAVVLVNHALVPGAGWVPTPSSLGMLGGLLTDGFSTVNTTMSPITPSPSVLAVVVVSLVGLWWVADVLSTTLGVPAAGALALLAVYCVPSSILFAGVPWQQFAASVGGLVALLAVGNRDRLAQWGRRIDSPGTGPSLSRIARAVVAGGLSLGLALFIPTLLPGLGGGLMSKLRADSRTGPSDALSTELDLRRDLNRPTDRPLVRYTTTSTDPGPLRMFTVASLNNERWTVAGERTPVDAAGSRFGQDPATADPRLVRRTTGRFSATTVGLRQTYLPFPSRFVAFSANQGRWNYDTALGTISGPVRSTPQLRYTMTVAEVQPRAEIMAQRTAPAAASNLPAEYLSTANASSMVRDRARAVAGTGTDYVKAQRLQAWFRSGGRFIYSTEVNGSTTRSAMDVFLSERRGYCVHFATAMTLMAREVGIPARVAVGLLPGERDGAEWVASERDAHAWPELYFQGAGWVRFEPTPAARTGTAPSWTVPDVAATSTPSSPSASPTSSTPTTTARTTAAPSPTSSTTAPSRRPAESGSIPWRTVAAWLAGLVGVLGIVMLPRALAALVRRHRRTTAPDPAEAAWDELTERLADLGVRPDPSRTVRGDVAHIAEQLGPEATSARAALDRLAKAVEQARYGSSPGDAAAAGIDDVTAVVSAVAQDRSIWRRLSATWFPRSGLRRR